MLVRAVGFTTSAAVQIALIGQLAPLIGLPGSSRHSLPLLRQALTHDARRLTVGMIGYGLLGAAITIPISLKLFGVRLVTGPLPRPTARRLIAAEASNALATSISAPLFALMSQPVRPHREQRPPEPLAAPGPTDAPSRRARTSAD